MDKSLRGLSMWELSQFIGYRDMREDIHKPIFDAWQAGGSHVNIMGRGTFKTTMSMIRSLWWGLRSRPTQLWTHSADSARYIMRNLAAMETEYPSLAEAIRLIEVRGHDGRTLMIFDEPGDGQLLVTSSLMGSPQSGFPGVHLSKTPSFGEDHEKLLFQLGKGVFRRQILCDEEGDQ